MQFEVLKNALAKYLDNELLPKISGWQKWVVGAGLSMYLEKGVDLFNDLKNNSFVQMLDVISSDNDINVEKLYKHFLKESKKSAITFKSKLLGDITINSKDVETIYCYIRGEEQ